MYSVITCPDGSSSPHHYPVVLRLDQEQAAGANDAMLSHVRDATPRTRLIHELIDAAYMKEVEAPRQGGHADMIDIASCTPVHLAQ